MADLNTLVSNAIDELRALNLVNASNMPERMDFPEVNYTESEMEFASQQIVSGYLEKNKGMNRRRGGLYIHNANPFALNYVANCVARLICEKKPGFRPQVILVEPENPRRYQIVDLSFFLRHARRNSEEMSKRHSSNREAA